MKNCKVCGLPMKKAAPDVHAACGDHAGVKEESHVQLVKAGFAINTKIDAVGVLKRLEVIGRTCYQSYGRITGNSYEPFVKMIMERGHLAIIEHESLTVTFVVDTGVSHEIVRHRLASFAQESSRFCSYIKDSFGSKVKVVTPVFWVEGTPEYDEWLCAMEDASRHYMNLMKMGAKPEEARSVLPKSLRTEIVVTANLREWRWFLSLRTSPKAHPQMREVAIPLKEELQKRIPIIFEEPLSDADRVKELERKLVEFRSSTGGTDERSARDTSAVG